MSDLYIVVVPKGNEIDRTEYYQGWWQQYTMPMFSRDRKDALKMSRGGAYRAAARIRDPKTWGAPARVELA